MFQCSGNVPYQKFKANPPARIKRNKKSETSSRWYCTLNCCIRCSGNVPEIQGEPAGADQAEGGEAATGPRAGGEEAAAQHGASKPRSK